MVLSVILPVYNECNRLGICVDKLSEYLSRTFNSYEIIIVEDCSSDGSLEVANRIASERDNIVVLHNDKRLGRGASLNQAISVCKGDCVIYMDVDLATDINYIKNLVDSIVNGASIATGSRLMKGSNATRPLIRDIASRAYNLFVRLLFMSKIHDHQCGFKAMNRRDIQNIIPLLEDNHWFWDTELLIIAQKMGYYIDELPVAWRHNGGNNLNLSKVRVFKDSIYMGKRILKLRWRLLHKGLYDQSDEGFSISHDKGR